MRRQDYNEDIKVEKPRQGKDDKKQLKELRTTFTKKFMKRDKDDHMANEEAQEILSSLDPKFVQSVLPRREEEKLKVVTASLEFARGI